MKQYKLSYLIVAALMISGCSNEAEWQEGTSSAALKVHAQIEGAQTRATATAFASEDAIGLFVDNEEGSTNTKGENVKYVATDDEGNFKAADTPIYFLDAQTVDLSAYFPYDPSLTASQRAISFNTLDQSDLSELDYLYASGTGNFEEATELTFHHVMSKLSFTFVAGEGVTDLANDLTDFTLEDLLTAGEFDTSTGIASAKLNSEDVLTLDLKEVEVITTTDEETEAETKSKTQSVILFPQSAVDQFILTLTYKDMSFVGTVNLPSDGLQAGMHYTYTLTVSPVGLDISGYTIQSWNTEEYSGNALTAERVNPWIRKSKEEVQTYDYVLKDGTFISKDISQEELQSMANQVVGIVFWMHSDDSYADFTHDYALLNDGYKDYTHGLILAVNSIGNSVWQEGDYNWSFATENSIYESFQKDHDIYGGYFPIATNLEMDDATYSYSDFKSYITGYSNTQILRAYNKDGDSSHPVKVVSLLDQAISEGALTNLPSCSPWYIPSVKELALIINGDTELVSLRYSGDLDFHPLKAQFKKLQEDVGTLNFWSSSEIIRNNGYDNQVRSFSIYIDFKYNGVSISSYYKDEGISVYPVCSF
jgi:hypothetical protein